MSKRIKGLLQADIKKRLGASEGVAVLSPRGLGAFANNKLRRQLRDKGARMLVVRNNLARRAMEGSKLQGFEKLLTGPSAIIYGDASIPAIARLLVEAKKLNDKLELKGVFFDGDVYEGEAGVKTASELPTREEAIANVLAAALSPARKLAGILKAPASIIASILKTIEERAPQGGDASPEADAAAAADAPAAGDAPAADAPAAS